MEFLWNFGCVLIFEKAQIMEIVIMEKLYHKIQDFRADITNRNFMLFMRVFCAASQN